jgi:hypothetical protein
VRIPFHSIEEHFLSSCPRSASPDKGKNVNEIPFLDDTFGITGNCLQSIRVSEERKIFLTKQNVSIGYLK